MTQFKTKLGTEDATVGLLVYPVLMAADIFYLGGSHIVVGEDQTQHIEFARDLHDKYPCATFPKPEMVLSRITRVMSLKNAGKKMSKSDLDDYSRINLTDTPGMIRAKIAKAKTGMTMDEDTPEVINLKAIYKELGGNHAHTKFSEFKEELSNLIITELNYKN